jgi:Yip1 domain
MAYALASTGLTDRMLRAARLDVNLYEEVEADTNATSQALMVVVMASLAGGIGAAIGAAMGGGRAVNPIGGLVGGVLSVLLGWAVLSYVMFFVGTRLFKGTATYGELLRTLGFAYSPGVLLVLSFIPVVGGLIAAAVFIWRIATGFIAIRQALDLDTGNTIATIVVGIIGYFAVFAAIALLLAPFGFIARFL